MKRNIFTIFVTCIAVLVDVAGAVDVIITDHGCNAYVESQVYPYVPSYEHYSTYDSSQSFDSQTDEGLSLADTEVGLEYRIYKEPNYGLSYRVESQARGEAKIWGDAGIYEHGTITENIGLLTNSSTDIYSADYARATASSISWIEFRSSVAGSPGMTYEVDLEGLLCDYGGTAGAYGTASIYDILNPHLPIWTAPDGGDLFFYSDTVTLAYGLTYRVEVISTAPSPLSSASAYAFHDINLSGVTFVPEPATLSLLAFGGIALLRKRK
ncbi:MAG: hypothetical protein DRP56_07450 [Planctomycetota bacterium]|nr:MAG: hypothetical protein DRP56_07450 [Planctomycetota bacterium]